MVLLVAIGVAQFRKGAELFENPGRPVSEVFKGVGLQRVLELRVTLATANLQVL